MSEIAAAVDAARKRGAEVESRLKLKFEVLDTTHFMIFTDWDPREYQFLRSNMEEAYNVVAREFKTSSTDTVFLGNLPVYMFSRQDSFVRFSKEIDGVDIPKDVLGYYKPGARGFAHMAMWKPQPGHDAQATLDAERQWACTLTHEFTHAFVGRYRSNREIPRWLNEGVAEVVCHGQFPQRFNIYQFVRDREAKNNGLLTDILHDKGQLSGDDYPTVQTIVEFLQASRPNAFLKFFNDIKDGMGPEAALLKEYEMSFDELTEQWRRRIRAVK